MPQNMTLNHYVYGHYQKDTGELFYIGKGKKNRAWDLRSRNRYWKNIVQKHGYEVKILHSDLDEIKAFSLEIKLIEKLHPKANLVPGGHGGGIATYGFKGKNHTAEHNKKMSLKMQGKHNRPVTKEDVVRLNKFSALKMKPIVDNSTGIKYEGIRVAARSLNVGKTTIIKRIKNGKFSYV